MSHSQLKIAVFPDPLYAQNGRVVACQGDPACWFVDPGLPPCGRQMLTCVEANRLRPEAIVLTHAHADHIAGIPEIQRSWPGLPVYLAEVEWSFLTDPASNLSILSGLELRVPVKTTKDLPPGGELQLGDLIWKVLDTSGHSPGGRTLYQSQAGVAIVGDALFAGSIGRIDFPHSNGQTLLRNIREQLLVLPGGTRVLSGHGPDTTIEHELRHNTFL